MENAVERGSPPVLAWQGEDSPQVVEGHVTLGEGTLQTRFLEGGPLLLQGPSTTQISLREDKSEAISALVIWSPSLYIFIRATDLILKGISIICCQNRH